MAVWAETEIALAADLGATTAGRSVLDAVEFLTVRLKSGPG